MTAKKKVEKEVKEEIQVGVEPVQAESTIEVVEQKDAPVAVVKKVRVVTSKDHRCFIGGSWYTFKAGVQQNVPENVKEILNRAGVLAVL